MGRLRHIKNDTEIIKKSKYYFDAPLKNHNKNYLEIGTGKGDFLISNAIQYPEINFYGVDKFATVLLKAIKKLEKLDNIVPNIKFLDIDIKNVLNYFPLRFFSCIYLNFCDPWPKKRHEKRRLTSPKFLDLYKKLLNKDGEIYFKTDNVSLYQYTLDTLKGRQDIQLTEYTNDYYQTHNIEKTIKTEYEAKFIKQGIKINFIQFKYLN